MYAKHSELKVGVLVLVASAALLALLFFATGGAILGDWRHVQLRLEPGDLSPKEGDPVYMNGVEIGSVVVVDFRSETRRGDQLTPPDRAWLVGQKELRGPDVLDEVREIYVHMVAKLKADVRLPADTQGMVDQSITGSRTLRLIPGSRMEDLTDEATRAKPIRVFQAPTIGRVLLQLGDLTGSAAGAVKTANEALVEVKGLVADIREKVQGGRIEEVLADIRGAAAAVRRTIEGLEADLGKITTNIESASVDVKAVTATAVRIATSLEEDLPAAVKDVRDLVARVTGIVERAGPKVDVFLDDMNRTGKNLVKLSDEFGGIGPEAKGIVAELGRDLDELAAVLTDTGRNLLDASEDLRAHPWKLLNEPEADEIAYENLRQSMVNYVRAMSGMNATAQTLQTVLAKGQLADPTVQRLLQRTLAEFERSRDIYRSSERRFMELLQASTPGAAKPQGSRPSAAGSGSPPPPPPPPPARPR